MIPAKNVADYFISKCDPEIGDIITNLKLQKLVYYAQGFHLAMFDQPLFSEPVVAWEHGPVVEDLYREFRQYGSNALPQPETVDLDAFNQEQKELLDEVFQVYGQFSAWKLRNMTHSEAPWIETGRNNIIDPALMKAFFKTQIE